MSLRFGSAQFLEGFDQTLAAARNGEQSQLGVLLNVYRRYLLSVASEKLPQEVIAKAAPSDLVQETLFQACRAFEGFRGSSERELRAWLNRILARKIIEVHRYYREFAKRDISREIRLSDAGRAGDAMANAPVHLATPARLVTQNETAQSFDKALATLSADQRQAIQFRSIDQLSFEEIGMRLGKTADAAQKLWGRAVRTLSRALKPHESES
ncbi:sigma-70 family RNA polymerase sigma factor [Schlesneria paludicola]|uniref:sigma-70 family RNA polymerase sigma factor n=1 Tax=Schlesneria paludicola TaxID=360056 RepID=UPI0012F9F7F4|nr:sigma-70 family RNA polymerase sigma factor [Schlesneria paludicola]